MSYGVSAALQASIFTRLATDPGLTGLINGAVYDAVPPGTPPGTFVLLGPEEVVDKSDASGSGTEHQIRIVVVSAAAGFARAKQVAGAVSDALLGAPLLLDRGRVVGVWFQKASAVKPSGGGARRVELSFRVRVED